MGRRRPRVGRRTRAHDGGSRGLPRPRPLGLIAIALALSAVGAGVVWVAAGSDLSPDRVARERVFTDVSACLLTDFQGVAGPAAAAVWAGMQEASVETRARASYVPVGRSAKTRAAITPYLNSLILSDCNLVVAAGAAQVDAVVAAASAHPDIRFAVVGGRGGANVAVLPDAVDQARVAARQVMVETARTASSA